MEEVVDQDNHDRVEMALDLFPKAQVLVHLSQDRVSTNDDVFQPLQVVIRLSQDDFQAAKVESQMNSDVRPATKVVVETNDDLFLTNQDL
jgi:hypothetical protein